MIDYKKKFIEEYQKVPVFQFESNTCENPLVSVCVQTYKQVDFIRECLEGILNQKTNFDFEILLGEDDSQDGTRDICIEYAKKFPQKIKLFLHSRKNNIVIDGTPTGKFNVEYNIISSKGKYITICEGDDFWTDPLKLQKQINFLETNVDYGLVYSDIDLISGRDKKESLALENLKNRYLRIKKIHKSGNVFWDLLEKNVVNTLTVCAKKELIIDYFNNFPDEVFAYDHRQWLHIASYSKVKFIDEKLATYRVLNQGISRVDGFFDSRAPLVKQSALLHYLTIIKYDQKLIDRNIFAKVSFNILNNKYISKREKQPLISMFRKHPLLLFYLFRWKFSRLFLKLIN